MRVPEVIAKIAELGIAVGASPINKFPDCWEYQIDERWFLAFNWHDDERPVVRHGVALQVPARQCFIEYNGWPAGVIGFGGGQLAAGSCANEDTLIDAITAAITKAKEQPNKESP